MLRSLRDLFSPACFPLLQAQAEAARVTAILSAELAALDQQLLPVLLPALQAYTRAAAAAGSGGSNRSRSLPERDWQAAEAVVCGDLLQIFVTAGSMVAAANVSGQLAAGTLSDWMSGLQGEAGQPQHQAEAAAAWQLLSQHVASMLRAADRAFLLAAVDRATGGLDSTGELVSPASVWLAYLLAIIVWHGMAWHETPLSFRCASLLLCRRGCARVPAGTQPVWHPSPQHGGRSLCSPPAALRADGSPHLSGVC
jgi:hypothetical protein